MSTFDAAGTYYVKVTIGDKNTLRRWSIKIESRADDLQHMPFQRKGVHDLVNQIELTNRITVNNSMT